MTILTLRNVKGTPLTWSELDANFTSLNTNKVEVSDLEADGGSSLIGYKANGTGALPRTVEDKLHEFLSVKDFGAVGDGATDDVAAIEAADASLAPGGTLLFGKNKTYLCGSTVNIVNAGKLDLNGSTLKASDAVDAQLVSYQSLSATYEAPANFTAFSVTAKAISFPIPAGVTITAGNVLKLMSNTARITDYNHGMMATVISVSGGVATINTPFYDAFQVDKISVYRGFQQMEVCNGTFDLLNIGNAVDAFTEGLLVRGGNAYVHDCVFIGSQYAGIGVRVESDGALIENCKAYGFRNTQGITGGGRIGYGFAAYGNNTRIRGCLAHSCKHGLASGSREIVSINVNYQNCQVYEDPSAPSTDYSGSIDMHYNVTGVSTVENCRVYGQSRLLSIRAPGVTIEGGIYIQTVGGQLVEGFEAPYSNLILDGIKYYLATTASSLITISSSSAAAVTGLSGVTLRNCQSIGSLGRMIDITRASSITDLTLEGNKHSGGSMFRTSGGNISGLIIRNNVATVTEGAVRASMDGATYSANEINISGNAFTRNVATSNENVIYLDSSTATRITAKRLKISDNSFNQVGDTGTGYTINLFQLAATFFELSGNRVERGSFRCISIDGCSIIRGQIRGQNVDGSILVQNNADATVLTDVLVHGNGGDSYTVSVAGLGVTKTRYVDADNNFVTYTP